MLSARQILPIARQIRELTRQNDAIFLVNDRLDIALGCEADGVHLGNEDFPVPDARRVLGERAIIGVSAKTPERARAAQREGATYLGVGAIFGTQTKLDAGGALGSENLRLVVDATTLPVAAIGGVNADNINSVFDAGASMACVISALCHAGSREAAMEMAARELVALCEKAPR